MDPFRPGMGPSGLAWALKTHMTPEASRGPLHLNYGPECDGPQARTLGPQLVADPSGAKS